MDPVQLVVVGAVILGVVAFITWPLIRSPSTAVATRDGARIEARIAEYRASLKRRTLCERCLFPNPERSRYCADCGSRLPGASAST